MKLRLNGKIVETKKRTIREMLIEKGINPEIVLVRKEDKLVPEETELKQGDKIEVIKIVSGG